MTPAANADGPERSTYATTTRPAEAVGELGAKLPAAPLDFPSTTDNELLRGRAPAAASGANAGANPASRGLEYPRVALALSAVIALIFALRWAAKKYFPQPGRTNGSSVVQVLARSPLAPRQQILILRVGRRILVVGDTGSQMNPLSEITDPDEVATLIGQLGEEKAFLAARPFSSLFSRARQELSPDEATDAADRDAPHPADETEAPGAAETGIAATRDEISGLMERVRGLSQQFRKT